MKKGNNPRMGGSYLITQDGKRVLVAATDRKPTDQERKAVETTLNPKPKANINTDGGI